MVKFPIDFVVAWVDGNDPDWVAEKNKYDPKAGTQKKGMNSKKAFRDWGTFKYWFRGVEKFAPWVHKIYLVTNGQIPTFLNLNNKKIKLITHKEFIPKEYLPTFNANTIETNLNKIPGLAEHFVYFNDDMYLTSLTNPEDFFDDRGLPKYNTSLSPIIPERYGTANFQVNDMEIVTTYFSKNEILKNGQFYNYKQGIRNLIKTTLYKNSKFICGFFENHMPYPLLKSKMDTLWDKEYEILNQTGMTKFRETSDVNIWLFKYWNIASGQYCVGDNNIGKLFSLDDAGPELWNTINSNKYKIMCINDGFEIHDEEKVMNDFIGAINKLLPQKSSFEV